MSFYPHLMKRTGAAFGVSAVMIGGLTLPTFAADTQTFEMTTAWDTETRTFPSGSIVNAIVNMNNNYPEGTHTDDDQNMFGNNVGWRSFTWTASDNAYIIGIPNTCNKDANIGKVSTISSDGKSITCHFQSIADFGEADSIYIPVRIHGVDGNKLNATVADDSGNKLSPDELSITSEDGLNVAIANPNSDLERTGISVDLGIFNPPNTTPPTGSVTFDLTANPTNAEFTNYVNNSTVTFGDGPGAANEFAGMNGATWSYTRDGNVFHITANNLTPDYAQTTFGGGQNANGSVQLSTARMRMIYTNQPESARYTAGSVEWNISNVKYTSSTTNKAYTQASGQGTANLIAGDDDKASSAWTSVGAYNQHIAINDDDSGLIKRWPGWEQDPLNYGISAGSGWSGQARALPGNHLSSVAQFYLSANQTVNAYNMILPGQKAHFTGNYNLWGLTGGTVYYTTSPIDQNTYSHIFARDAHWTTTKPTDPKTITGISIVGAKVNEAGQGYFRTEIKADNDAEPGSWIWTTGAAYHNGQWVGAGGSDGKIYDPGQDGVPPYTNGMWDVFQIIPARVYTTINITDKDAAARSGQIIPVTGTVSTNVTKNITGNIDNTFQITLQPGTKYVSKSMRGIPEPDSVSTDQSGQLVLKWDHLMISAGQNIDYSFDIQASRTVGTHSVTSKIVWNVDPYISSEAKTDYTISQLGSTILTKTADADTMAIDLEKGIGSWTLALTQLHQNTAHVMDTIDILPYKGDSRNPDFTGSITVMDILAGTGDRASNDIYVTKTDPATLKSDPADTSNSIDGKLGQHSDTWTKWDGSTESLNGVTAIRWIAKEVFAGATLENHITYTVDQVHRDQKIVNSAVARSDNTELRMIESADTQTVGDPSPLQVDKEFSGNPNDTLLTAGQKIQYTITARADMKGNGDTDVVVTDNPIQGLESIVYNTPSKGSVSDNKWSIGDMQPGEVHTLHATATISNNYAGKAAILNNAVIGSPANPAPNDLSKCQINPGGVTSDTDQCDTVKIIPTYQVQVDKQRITEVRNDTDPETAVKPGDTVTYKVTVHATAGEQNTIAPNVSVKDLANSEETLANVQFTQPSKGSVDQNTWLVGDLHSGETQTAYVTGIVTDTAIGKESMKNYVTAETPYDPAPPIEKCETNSGDVATDNDRCDNPEIPVLPPSVPQLDKVLVTDSTTTALKSNTVVDYTLTVRAKDNGSGETGVTVKDIGGEWLENVTLSDPDKGTVNKDTWTIGLMRPGEQLKVNVHGTIKKGYKGQDVVNIATVTSDHSTPNPNPLKECQVNEGVLNDTDLCDKVTVVPEYSVKIDKTRVDGVGSAEPVSSAVVPGDIVTYKVTVKNPSTSTTAAPDVLMKELVNQDKTLSNVMISQPSKGSVNGFDWTIGDMAVGETQTAYVTGTVTDAAIGKEKLLNYVSVETPEKPAAGDITQTVENPNVDDDTDQRDVTTDPIKPPTPPRIDKALLDEDPILIPGEKLHYRVTVKMDDDGSGDTNVMVSDLLGHGLKDIQYPNPSVGSIDGVQWSLGLMRPGQIGTIDVEGTISDDYDFAGVTNRASVGSDHFAAPDSKSEFQVNDGTENDTDRGDSVTVDENSKLQIDKVRVDSNGNPTPSGMKIKRGETITYTVTAKNSGTTISPNVIVKDLGDVKNGAINNIKITHPSAGEAKDGVWNVGHMKAGAVETATVTATVITDTPVEQIYNAVTIENGKHPFTLDPANDNQVNSVVDEDSDQWDRVDDPVVTPIHVDKTLTTEKPDLSNGKTLTYAVTVQADKTGSGETGVKVTDLGGDYLADVVISQPSTGEVKDGVWMIGDMKPGQKENATVTATVANREKAETVFNTVIIEGDNNPRVTPQSIEECETNSGDVTTDNDQCDVVGVGEDSKLLIDKVRVGEGKVKVGDTIEWTVTVKNADSAPTAATNVSVADLGDPTLEKIELSNPSVGSVENGEWRVGSLEPGQKETITVSGSVKEPDAEKQVHNAAIVYSPVHPATVQKDGQINEDIDSDTDQWDRADVDVEMTVSPMIQTGAETLGVMLIGSAGMLGAITLIMRRKR